MATEGSSQVDPPTVPSPLQDIKSLIKESLRELLREDSSLLRGIEHSSSESTQTSGKFGN